MAGADAQSLQQAIEKDDLFAVQALLRSNPLAVKTVDFSFNSEYPKPELALLLLSHGVTEHWVKPYPSLDCQLMTSIAKEHEWCWQIMVAGAPLKTADPNALFVLAMTNKDRYLRAAAVRKLEDQGLLKRVGMENSDTDVRIEAAQKILNPGDLNAIASQEQDSFGPLHLIAILRRILVETGTPLAQAPIYLYRNKLNSGYYRYGAGLPTGTIAFERVTASILDNSGWFLARKEWAPPERAFIAGTLFYALRCRF